MHNLLNLFKKFLQFISYFYLLQNIFLKVLYSTTLLFYRMAILI